MNELDKIFSDPTTPAQNIAPADSITVKVLHPLGYDVMLTLRGPSTELLPRFEKAVSWLVDKGYSPTTGTPSNGHSSPAANGNGAAPVCNVHNKPMKPSQHGGYYCTAKLADGTYCKETAK